MTQLPTGTVTFLFTDIEGSTQLWEQHPEAMKGALARHNILLRQAIEANNGYVFKTVGDAFCAAFTTAPEALMAALTAQRTLHAEAWGEVMIRVRMALHTGAADEHEGDYFGLPLSRAARLRDAGYGGQILVSLTTETLVRGHLPAGAALRDMGKHCLKDFTLAESIFQLNLSDLPTDFPPLKTLNAFRTNLPTQLTSFIGREKEITEVKRLLSEMRLVTLTGPGGTGKTRLSFQVATELLESLDNGVWLVELAPLSDPGLVPQTVATALGLREVAGRPITETLIDYLRAKDLLLLFDNCEHLVEASAELADSLLHACPHLRLLATSREALGIAGELPFRVPSLSLPDPKKSASLEAVTQSEAVQLFVERAGLALPGFALTEANATAVAQICHRLDGIPLAIELAAARVKMLTVEQIAARLDDRFRLLTGGSRTALPRQQTLRALIDWSYDLLSETERTLLRQLSVFVGGWTLEAAEGVCVNKDEGEVMRDDIHPSDVFDLLTQLVNKSLVTLERDQGREARYHLFETIRQYAREKLVESGEEEQIRNQHLEFFLKRAEEIEPKLFGAEQKTYLEQMEVEHDNARAALAWSLEESTRAEAGLRLAAALWFFWYLRGYWSEAHEWLERMLAVKPEAPSAPYALARAKALNGAGWLAGMHPMQEDYSAQAIIFCEESLALSRALGEKREIAFALRTLGRTSNHHDQALEESLALFRETGNKWGMGEVLSLLASQAVGSNQQRALELNQESLAIRRALVDKDGMAWSLYQLGDLAMFQGDFERAKTLYEESLSLFREMSSRFGIACVLREMGAIAWFQGESESATAMGEESQALFRELGDKWFLSDVTLALGGLALEQGDFKRAVMLVEEALVSFRQLENRPGVARALQALGRIRLSQGDYERAGEAYRDSLILIREDEKGYMYEHVIIMCLIGLAGVTHAQTRTKQSACLLGVAEKLIEKLEERFKFPPPAHADYHRTVVALSAELDEATFSAAWANGRAMTLEQAVAYALED